MRHPERDYNSAYNEGMFWIYIYKIISDQSLYKVGVSGSPEKRKCGIKKFIGYPVELIYTYEFNYHNFFFQKLRKREMIKQFFEGWIHFKLKKYKFRGEYYILNEKQLNETILLIKNNKIIPFYSQFGCIIDF